MAATDAGTLSSCTAAPTSILINGGHSRPILSTVPVPSPWSFISATGSCSRTRLRRHSGDCLVWEPGQCVPIAGGEQLGGKSTAAFVRHGFGIPADTVEIGGLAATTLSRTVVDVADVAATVGFAHAVVVADAALRRTEHPHAAVPRTHLDSNLLLSELACATWSRGAAKALRVIEFADGRADRPGESMSRVSMHLARLTAPELQVRMLGASGSAYFVDFWWPEFNVIGEFDGKYKYTNPEYMAGRTAQQVLYDEKLREDDLRAAAHGFSRWPWATAVSPTLLRAHLARAGVR